MKTLLTIALICLAIQLVICIICGFTNRNSYTSYWEGFFDGLFWLSIFSDNDWDDWD